MNTKTIVALLMAGTAIVLVPPIIEVWSAHNAQRNVAEIMIETKMTSVSLRGFALDETLKFSLFWLGTFVICVAVGFMWNQRKHCTDIR